MPKNLDDYFVLNSQDGCILLREDIHGIDNGDHLLFFNDIDIRQIVYAQFSERIKNLGIRPKTRVHITILKAGHDSDHFLR